jgi:hypothetical protein
MNYKKSVKGALLIAVLGLTLAPFNVNSAVGIKPTNQKETKLDDADYSLSYDSFVLGALPIWINRTFDDGPKRIELRIQFESGPTFYRTVDFIDGTTFQVTYNEYAGPGFVEVNIESITPL